MCQQDATSGTSSTSRVFHKGNSIMSLAFALLINDIVYIAADSKSSGFLNEDNLGFGTHNHYMKPLLYDYKKIFRIEDTNILGFSVGDNTIGSYNLLDYIKNVKFSNKSNLNEIAENICDSINNINNTNIINSIEFHLFDYSNKGCWHIPVIKTINDICRVNESEVLNDIGPLVLSPAGADWAISLARNSIFYSGTSEEDVLYRINKIFNDAAHIGHYFDDSVGGLTRIIKLEPGENPKWIQGEYNL